MISKWLSILLLSLCFACEVKIEEKTLSSYEASFLPYQVGDTLVFMSDLKNIQTWVVRAKVPSVNHFEREEGEDVEYTTFRLTMEEISTNASLVFGYEVSADGVDGIIAEYRNKQGNYCGGRGGFSSNGTTEDLTYLFFDDIYYWFVLKPQIGIKDYRIDGKQIYER